MSVDTKGSVSSIIGQVALETWEVATHYWVVGLYLL